MAEPDDMPGADEVPAADEMRAADEKDPEALYWDGRYASADLVWSAGPNMFLPPAVSTMPPGRAVDLACGEGRNALWLAEQGWRVTGVDFSEVAISKATRIAEHRGLAVDWVCADATRWTPAAGGHDDGPRFDLAVLFYLQLPAEPRRRAVANACRLLAPAGNLLVVAHDSSNLTHGVGGPQDPSVLYRPADVLDDLGSSGVSFEIEQAETLERPVEGADRPALDCLVRARRTT